MTKKKATVFKNKFVWAIRKHWEKGCLSLGIHVDWKKRYTTLYILRWDIVLGKNGISNADLLLSEEDFEKYQKERDKIWDKYHKELDKQMEKWQRNYDILQTMRR